MAAKPKVSREMTALTQHNWEGGGGLIEIPFFKTAKLHDFKKKNKGYATQNDLKHIKDNRDCWENIY